MKKKMVYSFPVSFAQVASIHNDDLSLPEIIRCKNLSKGCRPREECRPRRSLSPPHTLPTEMTALTAGQGAEIGLNLEHPFLEGTHLGLVCLGLCLGELSIYSHVGGRRGRSRSASVWKMVPICIRWCVWKERNFRCFEDLENSMENFVTSFFHTLYLWTEAFLSPVCISFSDFFVRFSLP
jgi:hypothetical protein